MTEHPLDELAAYSIGVLDPDEQRTVGRHDVLEQAGAVLIGEHRDLP